MIAAAAFAPITYWLMRGLTFSRSSAARSNTPELGASLYLCSLIGIAVTALPVRITEYYTSTRFSPVKKTAKASITGHATNIIQGFASGLQATALPALVIVLGILGAWKLAGGGMTGIYGIGVAVMGQLSLTGLIVALDAFGPITDNAGGIAEMADLPEEVRKVTDRARRGRQHDEGGHQGLRDRLGRAGRGRAVRGLPRKNSRSRPGT